MSIADIKNIIHLVSSSKAGVFKNYFQEKRSGTKIQELLDGIISNKINNDEEASTSIYGSGPSNKGFMILRRDLLDNLSQSLLYYDFSHKISSNPWRRIVCQRKFLAIQILLSVGARATAINLAERVLQEAEQLEFILMEIQCLRILRETAALNGKPTQFDKYNKALSKKLLVYNAEVRAESECQRIEVSLINTAARPQGIYDRAMVYLDELEEVRIAHSSFGIELYRFRILLYALQINHDYDKAIEVCKEAERYLKERKDVLSQSRIAEFKTVEVNCAIKIRNFAHALKVGLECLDVYQSGKRNWFNISFRLMQIHFYTRDYKSALDIFLKVSSNSGFASLSAFQKEIWNVYRGYFALFVDTGKLNVSGKKLQREFSISEIIQETNEIIQDKKGLNIALLLLHILYSLKIGDFELVSTRIYLFQEYAKRYLNADEHKRTLVFLLMLKLLRKAKFNRNRARKLSAEYIQILKNMPEAPEELLESNEVMLYEDMWDWILDNLK